MVIISTSPVNVPFQYKSYSSQNQLILNVPWKMLLIVFWMLNQKDLSLLCKCIFCLFGAPCTHGNVCKAQCFSHRRSSEYAVHIHTLLRPILPKKQYFLSTGECSLWKWNLPIKAWTYSKVLYVCMLVKCNKILCNCGMCCTKMSYFSYQLNPFWDNLRHVKNIQLLYSINMFAIIILFVNQIDASFT